MFKYASWLAPVLFVLLTITLPTCGGTDLTQFQPKSTGAGGQTIGINTVDQAVFQGNIYFTLDRNLYVLNGNKNLHQLTRKIDVRDPTVSPNGKWIAFDIRHQNWSDLAYMPASGGRWTVLRHGAGEYVYSTGADMPHSTAFWYAQPAWAPDSTHLLFLSDWAKTYTNPGVASYLLDLQLFSISINDPTASPQAVAYATYGDGGLRDPSYRPNHPNQIIYTSYRYDATGTQQVIQLYLEDPNAISLNPGQYHPGIAGVEYDPAIALTPSAPNSANLEPTFSPNGNTLLYVRREDATHMSLYTMPVANVSVTNDANNANVGSQALAPYNHASRLLTGKYLSQPVWSSDGRQIIYLDNENDTFNIWLAHVTKNAQTGSYSIKDTPIQLTDAGGHLDADSRPCWTP
ncbi:MAG TPA: hypothetical protein VHZ51_07635 [Ktedonobacteraceae bacterium]|jgi:Tol biopolymer transport system component|nr:hypothetical protein [Ktedonobacteraceae bacterium]